MRDVPSNALLSGTWIVESDLNAKIVFEVKYSSLIAEAGSQFTE